MVGDPIEKGLGLKELGRQEWEQKGERMVCVVMEETVSGREVWLLGKLNRMRVFFLRIRMREKNVILGCG